MSLEKLSVKVLDEYAQVDEQEIDKLLNDEINNSEVKFVVLDDDPTGVQTVHDVSVYTNWEKQTMVEAFNEDKKLFYILTNSRGMTSEATTKVHQEIMEAVDYAAKQTGQKYLYISRSDSTLRGHYPLETELLRGGLERLGTKVDGEVLVPFFKEGGRFTINNVHYVKEDEWLVPAEMTEFAKDKTFGYSNSEIPKYVEEKTNGQYKADGVVCISLEMLRSCDYQGIEEILLTVNDFNKVCVNAIDYSDIKVFAVALYRTMKKGKTFVFRSAAGFVKVIGGISNQQLLSRSAMISTETSNGGVVIVGSHMEKTTKQLNELLKLENVVPVEFNSNLVLEGDNALDLEVKRCVAEIEMIIEAGKTAVCFTKRKLLEVEQDSKESALRRSIKISNGVQSLVARLKVTPAFIVAKGGITSSDIGTKALQVKRANVMGQIKPGIPVWQTGAESRFPNIPYVIFPGNVGEITTLKEAVEILCAKN